MPVYIPVMPIVFLLLLLLPIRLGPVQLKALAFFLWLMGGLILCGLGISRLLDASVVMDSMTWLIVLVVAAVVGLAKGKFVLSKTSNRNIDRLNQLTQPMRPIHVYSIRSWAVIAIMVLISVVLNLSNAPLLWRGGVNLAIGFGLIVSSIAYLQSLRGIQPPNTAA